MRKSLLFFTLTVGVLLANLNSWGQVSVAPGGSFTQDFNSFQSNTSLLPSGWKWSKDAGTPRTVNLNYGGVTSVAADNTMPTASCASSNGSYYAFNTVSGTGGSDRCLAFLSSSSATKNGYLCVAVNNSGASAITSFDVSYIAKKFRNGSNTAGFSYIMYYSTNGTSWTAMGSAFNAVFSADANTNCPTSTSAGTLPSVSVPISAQTYTPSSAVAAGGVVYFMWNYAVSSSSTTSNAQLLGVDDVTIAATGAPAGPTITTSTATYGPFCNASSNNMCCVFFKRNFNGHFLCTNF